MATAYFLAEYQGRKFVRSTVSRSYKFATIFSWGASFHASRDNAGREGRPVVAVRQITPGEAKRIATAQRAARNAKRSPQTKLYEAVRLLRSAQADQRFAGTYIQVMNMVALGHELPAIDKDFPGYGWMRTARPDLNRWQKKQANAYKRIVKYGAEVEALQAALEQAE